MKVIFGAEVKNQMAKLKRRTNIQLTLIKLAESLARGKAIDHHNDKNKRVHNGYPKDSPEYKAYADKSKEWVWYSEFEEGKITFLAAKDDKDQLRWKWGNRNG